MRRLTKTITFRLDDEAEKKLLAIGVFAKSNRLLYSWTNDLPLSKVVRHAIMSYKLEAPAPGGGKTKADRPARSYKRSGSSGVVRQRRSRRKTKTSRR